MDGLKKKRIERNCVVCGKKLEIIVHPDKSYEGGHFFFSKDEECPENEYWECDDCFNETDDDENGN